MSNVIASGAKALTKNNLERSKSATANPM